MPTCVCIREKVVERFPFRFWGCINKCSRPPCNILGSFRLASAKLPTIIYRRMVLKMAFPDYPFVSLNFPQMVLKMAFPDYPFVSLNFPQYP